MTNFCTSPDEENLVLLLQHDPIGRNIFLSQFLKLIDKFEYSSVIGLDGEWGSGKTIFVKQAQYILDGKGKDQTFENLDRKFSHNFRTAYYDAWKNDDAIDPALSLAYTICSNLREEHRDIGHLLMGIAKILDQKYCNGFVSSFVQGTMESKKSDIFAALDEASDLRIKISELINQLIPDDRGRLVVFVDELDRCRPTYAVELLERVKHFFQNSKVTFVFSINMGQLQHTIKCRYGADFNAVRYLDRFFDFCPSLPAVNINKFLDYKFSFLRKNRHVDMVSIHCTRYFRLTLREIEHYFAILQILRPSIVGINRMDGLAFAQIYILPLLIALKSADHSKFSRFINGQGSEIMTEVLLPLPIEWERLFKCTNEIGGVEKHMNEIYHILFSPSDPFTNSPFKVVGELSFDQETREVFMESISLLSFMCNYDS